MLELLIAITYVILGIILFKIDINYDLSGILTFGCFENKGFEILFIFYAAMTPIVLFMMIMNSIRKMFVYIFKTAKQ